MMKHLSVTVIEYLLIWASIPKCLCTPRELQNSSHTAWENITSSPDLQFHPCYNDFECARLILPLDWQAPVLDWKRDRVVLAIIRLPAVVPRTHPSYSGTVIVNPGGPGESGVNFLRSSGKDIRETIDGGYLDDRSNNEHFDIIAFDPRGVLFSTPNALCFSDPMMRKAWETAISAEGLLDQGEHVRRSFWARAKSLGVFCENTCNKTKIDIRRHMSTASVARDMLAIVDLLKQQQIESEVLPESSDYSPQRPLSGVSALDSRPNIKYWGWSYGTILGMTFASLFPDRIDNMVLDGVMDADDYIANGWTTNLEDGEAVMQDFYEQCSNAGASCALFDPAGPVAIEESLTQFLQSLRKEPLYDFEPAGAGIPSFITYANVKKMIFSSLYHPSSDFARMADSIWQLKQRNSSALFDLEGDLDLLRCSACEPETEINPDLYDGYFTEVGAAILCGDGEDMGRQTYEEFERYLKKLDLQSPTMGAVWAQIRLSCTGWKVRPKWRFTGPFAGNTSRPILFVSTMRDPVTPVSSARRMAKRFPGSVVLEQESSGHTSRSAKSDCTRAAIGRYFQDGTMPVLGTRCAANQQNFNDGFDMRESIPSRRHRSGLPLAAPV